MVLASRPLDSSRRLAARPVGAASSTRRPERAATRVRRIVVLPVPGPPVRISTFSRSAAARASACGGSRVSPRLPWARAMSFSGPALSAVRGAAARRWISRAIPASAACRAGRYTEPSSTTTLPAAASSAGLRPGALRQLQQHGGPAGQLLRGQAGVPFGLAQREQQPGLQARGGVAGQAQAGGHAVGGAEADAVDLLGQAVGVFRGCARWIWPRTGGRSARRWPCRCRGTAGTASPRAARAGFPGFPQGCQARRADPGYRR